VRDADGAVAGAVVRVQATENHVISDEEGRFTFSNLDPEQALPLSAWSEGYYIAGGETYQPGRDDIEITLIPLPTEDNPDYTWLTSEQQPGMGENQGCAECHSNEGTEFTFSLPVDEWRLDAHANSTSNPRFLTMYEGTDILGNQSPPRRYGLSRDYGRFPLRPDPDLPYYGPGYKVDFPDTAGNCSACHAPLDAVNSPYGVDPTAVSDIGSEGISCDFCHKVWDVQLEPGTGRPRENMPGVLSYEFRRPPEDHQFFAGPLDDVAPGEDTYSQLQTQSQFCAPCHFGIFWGTTVYNSFGEWLDSPYSDPETGQTCQECHMPQAGVSYFALPEKGGLERDPSTIFGHRMPGALDETLLQNAVTMTAGAEQDGDKINVQVNIVNDQTGHHVPTDSPLRHLILLVKTTDENGRALTLLEGPVLPEWAGVGDPGDGHYADQPGMAYAKVLQELWTEFAPTGAYWNPTVVLSDNRIPAGDNDTTTYVFKAPGHGQARIEVTLLFRRAFIELMEQKGWTVPDIIMEKQTLSLPAAS
jgi:mono/diheme cytochrome c family protein